ncbi:MAG: hypothetical protein DSY46_03740 [Hydrogenimonas sp.]|nr:MAG: hypothetical protein DSY46_03740 [Hydrogenimonas sp.]
MAEKIDRNGSIVTAFGDVIVYDDTTILMADRVIYDMDHALLKLLGHVEMMKGVQYGALSDKVVIDLHHLHDTFEHPFLIDFSSELWLLGDKAQRDDDVITLKDALVSSCDVGCPDWYMQFTSLKYNRATEWMDLWNPVLYMHDTPILYIPYIGFSTNRERRTGLLRPYVGISSRDGLFYNQPLFIAPDPQWDLEITPQIRFNRGEGVFATLRFVDTPHSSGSLRTGYFYSKHSYVEAYNLKNSSHFGAQVNYQSRQLFTDEESQNHDGLYVDMTYLNDPDYLNLQARSTAGLLYSSQVQSRINYYFNTPENYVGIYGKYFIDTSLASNKETMQSIPVIQLHQYQDRLFNWNALHYAADYRISNFFTGSGKQIQLQELNVPMIFYASFFDNYLKLSISENFYYSYIGYQNLNTDVPSNYYTMVRNYHKIDLYSDLARKFDNLFHMMQMRATYNKPSFSSERGYIDPSVSVLRSPSENMTLSLVNYLYNQKGEEFIYYRLSQPILYENSDHRYGDLEQEFRYKFWSYYELYTDLFFSYYQGRVSSATSYVKYAHPLYDIMLTHFYKILQEERTSDFYSIKGTYKSESGNNWYGEVAYDNLDERIRRWGVGLHLFRHCWDLNLGVKDERKPILTSAGAKSVDNLVFYFQINLVPLGGFEQKYEQEF